jgi:hypothetical protein
MPYFTFVVLTLAVWRLSYMFVKEEGPLSVFKRIRRHFYAGEYDPEAPAVETFSDEDMQWWFSHDQIPKQGFMGGVLSCIYCTSVWFGFFFTLFFYVWRDASVIFALPFAMSCIAVLIEMWRMREEEEGQYYDEQTEE